MSVDTDSGDEHAESRIRSRVYWNSALWTAGNSLTTGGFLSYFAQELGGKSFALAVISAIPELAAVSGTFAQAGVRWLKSRRQLWRWSAVCARLLTFLIPLIAFLRFENSATGVWLLIALLAAVNFTQGIATTAYFSWLGDLFPRARWGALLAQRNNVTLLLMMFVPVGGALLRDYWKQQYPQRADALIGYVIVFLTGSFLLAISLVPMWRLPESIHHESPQKSSRTSSSPLFTRNFRWLLAHSWLLAISNGLTQAVFFQFSYRELNLSLTTLYLLLNGMYALQMLTAWWGGRESTIRSARHALGIGSLIAGCGVIGWILADHQRDWRWLILAYTCWGAFGAVNVAGQNLCMLISPDDQRTRAIGLFRQVAGFLAGLSGLLGGWLLQYLPAQFHLDVINTDWLITSYTLLFTVSLSGRWLAAAFVWGIHPDFTENQSR